MDIQLLSVSDNLELHFMTGYLFDLYMLDSETQWYSETQWSR